MSNNSHPHHSPGAKKPVPTSIQKYSPTEMQFVWNTGQTMVVPFRKVRFCCNCAVCVDEWTRERKIREMDIPEDIRPTRVELVGRYAVQIEWTDGHKTGIYPFDQLYEICIHAAHSKSAQGETK